MGLETAGAEPVPMPVNYVCDCAGSGYQGEFCKTERNECVEDEPCAEHSFCTDTFGSFECTCVDGFFGNAAEFCGDVDECLTGSSTCDVNAACVNSIGGFNCTCVDGYVGDGEQCDITTWSYSISVSSRGAVVGTDLEITVRALDIFGNLHLGEDRDVSVATNTDLMYRPVTPIILPVDVKDGVGSVKITTDTAGTIYLRLLDSNNTNVDVSSVGAALFQTSSAQTPPNPDFGRTVVSAPFTFESVDCDAVTTDAVQEFAAFVADWAQLGDIWTGAASLPNTRHAAESVTCDNEALEDSLHDWDDCQPYFAAYNTWRAAYGFRSGVPTWTSAMECECFHGLSSSYKIATCYLPGTTPEDVPPGSDWEASTLSEIYNSCLSGDERRRRESKADASEEETIAVPNEQVEGEGELQIQAELLVMSSHLMLKKNAFKGKSLHAVLHSLPCVYGSGVPYLQPGGDAQHATDMPCGGDGVCAGTATSEWIPLHAELELGMSTVVYASDSAAPIACIDHGTKINKASFVTINGMNCNNEPMTVLGIPSEANTQRKVRRATPATFSTSLSFTVPSANANPTIKQLKLVGSPTVYGMQSVVVSKLSSAAFDTAITTEIGLIITDVYGEDCSTNEWEAWSACSVPCNDGLHPAQKGTQTRVRRCPLESEAKVCMPTVACPPPTTEAPVPRSVCNERNGGCSDAGKCTSSEEAGVPGIITCECNAGFVGDGKVCTMAETDAAMVTITYQGSLHDNVQSLHAQWQLMQLLTTSVAIVSGVDKTRIISPKLMDVAPEAWTFSFVVDKLTASSTTPACMASETLVNQANVTALEEQGVKVNPYTVNFNEVDITPVTVEANCSDAVARPIPEPWVDASASASTSEVGWGDTETLWLLTVLLMVVVPFLIAAITSTAKETTKTKLIELGKLHPELMEPPKKEAAKKVVKAAPRTPGMEAPPAAHYHPTGAVADTGLWPF
jgi:hypothetical protein